MGSYRRRIARAVLWLTVLAALAAGCSGPERRYPLAGTEHFPLRDRRTLSYRQTRNGRITNYTWRLRWLGGNRIKVFALDVDGLDFGECTITQIDSAVVFVTTAPLTMLESPQLEPEFRQAWVDETVAHGDDWTDPDTGTRTVFTGFESVTVPAGTFPRCYRTVTEATTELLDSLSARLDQGTLTPAEHAQQLAQARLVVSRWFAPGIGLVKEQIGSPDFIRELIAVTDSGRGEILPPNYDPDNP
jgi:hypothetical protein